MSTSTHLPSPFGVLLQRYRLSLGLSQEELAERAGLSKRGISDLERGVRKAPYPDTVRRLSAALELDETQRGELANAGRSSVPVAQPSLPLPTTPLIGRTDEIATLCDRLSSGSVRLLTLTGTAGTGKTRLALAAAGELSDVFPDGICFIDLTSATEPDAVLPAIAHGLGVRVSTTGESLLEPLRAYLAHKRLLLVLDNFEHVLPAAPTVASLLDRCGQLVALLTSRAPARVRWEQVYPVQPLPVPSAAAKTAVTELLAVPSVQLFVERARDGQPDFELSEANAAAIAELCRRLDGLPLSIELAAARIRVLPPQALLGRLERRLDLLVGGRRDEPVRHHTLRAALTWSHDLLTPDEQVLFRRLSVFVGGCLLDDAEAVSSAGLDVLESLVDKSLLRPEPTADEPRFGMLESVLAYAAEQLAAAGEAEQIRARHASRYVDVVESALDRLKGPDQLAWLARLDDDFGNIRAALRWCARGAQAGDASAAELGLRLGGALWWYMHVRGLYAEVRQLVMPLLDAPAAQANTPARAAALLTAGVAAWGLGDYAIARAQAEQSVDLSRTRADSRALAQALIDVSAIAVSQNDAERVSTASTEGLQLARELGDDWMAAWALTFQGLHAIAQHDLDAAADRFDAALGLRQRLDDLFGLAWARYGLASVARLRGQRALARQLFTEALRTFRALGERPIVAAILDGLAEGALAERDIDAASVHFRESLLLYQEMDSPRGVGIALEGLASVAAARGASELAVQLAGAAERWYEAGGSAVEFLQRGDAHDWLATVRALLGEAGAAEMWASGRAMPLHAALEAALALSAPSAARGSGAPT